MTQKYLFAIPLLLAASVSVAEAGQEDESSHAAPKAAETRAQKAVAAGSPASASVIAGAALKPKSAGTTVAVAAVATTPDPKVETSKSAAPTPPEQPVFKFGGFGSVGLSHSSLSQGDYVLESAMPSGVGRSRAWSASNNTRVAAHVTATFSPQVSAIFQVDSEYHSDGSYSPEIEFFNVKYAFDPKAYIRGGRIALPTFMDSENRDIGYSFVWVNPPVDLYHQLPINSIDGVDATYRFDIGEVGNTVKAVYGTNTFERPTSVTTSKDIVGIFDTLEYGQATFHVSYQERLASTHNLLTGTTGPWVRNKDLSLGASYDPGNWFVISEWVQRRSTTKIGAMYVSGGYRIRKFTPYVLYSQNSPGSFYPFSTAPAAAALTRANRSQSTVSVGLRWDFRRNYDFKVQYDQVRLSANSNGYLANVPPGVTLYGSKFHVISAVVDFVF